MYHCIQTCVSLLRVDTCSCWTDLEYMYVVVNKSFVNMTYTCILEYDLYLCIYILYYSLFCKTKSCECSLQFFFQMSINWKEESKTKQIHVPLFNKRIVIHSCICIIKAVVPQFTDNLEIKNLVYGKPNYSVWNMLDIRLNGLFVQ